MLDGLVVVAREIDSTDVTKPLLQITLESRHMEIKHLIQRFIYKIEPNPEGGFIARPNDPSAPTLEAPTREELQQRIQANLAAALAEAFPGMKVPVANRQLKWEVHVERKPGGGFTVHSEEPGAPGIAPAPHEKIDHFAEELLGFVEKHFPEVSQAMAASAGTGDIKIFTNKGGVTLNAGSHLGTKPILPSGQAIQPNYVNAQDVGFGDAKTANPGFDYGDAVINAPITPQTSSSWPFVRFLLALLVIAAMMYFFLHRH